LVKSGNANASDRRQRVTIASAANGKEIATVIEAAILELYSTPDYVVKMLRAIYGLRRQGNAKA
jgi:hypothetical protein